MLSLTGVKRLLRRLHRDEKATGTIEYVLLIIVALIVLAAIYYLVQWAIRNTGEAAKAVEGEYE